MSLLTCTLGKKFVGYEKYDSLFDVFAGSQTNYKKRKRSGSLKKKRYLMKSIHFFVL